MPVTFPTPAASRRNLYARTGASLLVTALLGAGCIDLFGVRGNSYDDPAYCTGISPKPESCAEWCKAARRSSGEIPPGCGPQVTCLDLECGTDQGTSCGTCKGTDYCESGKCRPTCVGKTCGTDHGTACGTCAGGNFCTTEGQCKGAADCTGPKLVCGQSCVDPTSDAAHCGGCNRPCDGGPCQAGKCPRLVVSEGVDGGTILFQATPTHLYWMARDMAADGGFGGWALRRIPHGGGPTENVAIGGFTGYNLVPPGQGAARAVGAVVTDNSLFWQQQGGTNQFDMLLEVPLGAIRGSGEGNPKTRVNPFRNGTLGLHTDGQHVYWLNGTVQRIAEKSGEPEVVVGETPRSPEFIALGSDNVFLYRRQTAPGGAVVEAHAKNGGAQVDRVDVAESEIGYLLAGDRTAYVLGSSTTSLLTFVPGSTPRRATVSGKPITNLRLCGADDTGAYVTGNRATDGSSGSYVYRITPAGETVTLNPDNASPSNGECTVGKGIVYWPHYSGDKKGIRAYY